MKVDPTDPSGEGRIEIDRKIFCIRCKKVTNQRAVDLQRVFSTSLEIIFFSIVDGKYLSVYYIYSNLGFTVVTDMRSNEKLKLRM